MLEKYSIRWHSRAGQGAVTAAGFFAEAMEQFGYKVQSFPDFGAEKRGAPVVVFNRISKVDMVLDDPAHLTHIDMAILVDPTLVGAELEYEDVLNGLNEDGILFINTAKTEASGFNERFKGKIFHLNATQIALDTIGRNIPNVAMIGGLTSVLQIDFEKMKNALKEHLSHFFPENLVEKNLVGFDRGNEEILSI